MKRLLYITALIIIAACTAQKETVKQEDAPKPLWVNGKPIETGYYSGIGMAYKSAGSDFTTIAKNNALNDLASEISVDVKSTSLFYQIEQDDNLRQEFQANTRLKSKENLEGYELVGTWENENQYWIYYRLSQYEYEQIKKAREQKAIALSTQFFAKAEDFKASGKYAEALMFGVKAFAALKDYLAEPLQTEWHGKRVFLLVELYSFMQQTLSDIQLRPIYDQLQIKRGASIPAEQLSFLATGKMGEALAGIPIYLYYSGQRITNNQVYTNNSGAVSYSLNRLNSSNAKEYLQANVNMVALVSEATEDSFVRKLLAKLSGAEARIEIEIVKPLIFIESVENNMGVVMNTEPLSNAYKQAFIDQGFAISRNKETADYVLKIDAQTRTSTDQGRFRTAALDAHIELLRTTGELLYDKQIQGFMGMQLDHVKAGEDAYKKLAAEINKRYFREMRRQVFE
jgi:uncharacterized lipoprotein YajG